MPPLSLQTATPDASGPGAENPPSAADELIAATYGFSVLPPALAARWLLSAWIIALALHTLLIGFVLFGPSRQHAEEPLQRLVFVEPPPPPPAPLGVPLGSGAAPVASAPEAAPVPAEMPVEKAKTEEPKPEPVRPTVMKRVVTKPKVEPKPKPKPEPVVKAPPKPVEKAAPPAARKPSPAAGQAKAEPARGTALGSARGEIGGVVGGTPGGIKGGIVGGKGTGPVPAAQVANAPVLIRRVEPRYPDMARRRGVEGLVLLEAILDRDGKIESDVKVLRSIAALDESAIAAVRQWRFRPARDKDGTTVRVILEVPIRFVLR